MIATIAASFTALFLVLFLVGEFQSRASAE